MAPPLDLAKWIDDRFIREAYKAVGRDYDKDAKHIHDPKITVKKLPPAELWHAKKGIISYPGVAAMLAAAETFKKNGDLRATYVYDNTTGIKIFGHVAFFVKAKNGVVTAFMRKPDAEKFIKASGGTLVRFDGALKTAATKFAAPRIEVATIQ